jgi:hypothetical protein
MRRSVSVLVLLCTAPSWALDTDRLRVQRKEVFEFTEKPAVTVDGDTVTISFAVKDYCDVTVAIENAEGRIVRHLASGVLGPNAPKPFQRNSLSQTLVWDGKDELRRYVDDKENLTVRVSLGLKTQMERTLFWSPHRMAAGSAYALMRSTPEGMYVLFRGLNPQLILFDHDGNYVRTVYPFPRNKIEQVKGLPWQAFPPDNQRLPSKIGTHDQMSFVPDYDPGGYKEELYTRAMDVRNGRICLAGGRLVYLATDGSTGDMELAGPQVGYYLGDPNSDRYVEYLPNSVALSPDGKRAYLTGYMCHKRKSHFPPYRSWYHLVNVVDLETGKIARFAGSEEGAKPPTGSDNAHFRCPMSVACDAQGRVYVADNVGNRIQVFLPDGTYFRTIPVTRPGVVRVDPNTGEIWVRSSDLAIVGGQEASFGAKRWGNNERRVSETAPPRLTVFGPVEAPKLVASYPMTTSYGWQRKDCFDENVEIDFYAPSRTVWASHVPSGRNAHAHCAVRIYEAGKETLTPKRNFNSEAEKALIYPRPWRFTRPRMAVSPAIGLLYVGLMMWDTSTYDPCFDEVVVVDPDTGRIGLEPLPTDPEDMAFDWDGHIYLRTYNAVTRFDPKTWREVPFDYGDERAVSHGGSGGKPYHARSALTLPSGGRGGLHLGGFGVAPDGTVVAACINPVDPDEKSRMKEKNIPADEGGSAYTASVYPGRCRGQEIHIFDRQGKPMKMDVAPGINGCNDVEIDRDNNVYLLAAGTPYLDGQPYFNGRGCTLLKLVPGKLHGLAAAKQIVPLPEELKPKRYLDITRPGIWLEGAEWLFGPVGADGHYGSGGRCHCRVQGRFALDYFGRSFAPEVDRFRIVVLDANGNVILRVGRYGNVDDGMPLVRPETTPVGAQGGQPPRPRSIGGDEIAIMHVQAVKVDCDRRMFLADGGNQCIRSVRLGYHVTERVGFEDAPIGTEIGNASVGGEPGPSLVAK